MTIRSEIRAALAAGRKPFEDLQAACPSIKIRKQLLDNLYVLKSSGMVKSVIVDNATHWAIAKWPEKATDAPPPAAQGQKAYQENHRQGPQNQARLTVDRIAATRCAGRRLHPRHDLRQPPGHHRPRPRAADFHA